MSLEPMFQFKRTVKLGETDAAGRLYFLVPLNWCQETFEEFLLTKNYKLSEMLKGDFQTPVVRTECDLKCSASVGDEIAISIQAIELKNRSFAVKYKVFKDSEVLAEASMTHVCVDSRTGKSSEITDKLKKLLS